MLERYYVRPETCDRIRASWIGGAIERYVASMTETGYASRTVSRRIPTLVQFGEFALERGAHGLDDLAAHVGAFVDHWTRSRYSGKSDEAGRRAANWVRSAIERMLQLAVPSFAASDLGRRQRESYPFEAAVPSFWTYLRDVRGLRPGTIYQYRHHLAHFERYLGKIGLTDLGAISPAVLSAFVTNEAQSLPWESLRNLCGEIRVLLRHLHLEGILAKDVSPSVESPQVYRMSTIPRSITWDEVRRMLETVDRRSPIGRRDYALLLLMVTYGLRGHEVAALTLDDIDWRRDRLRIPERKAGHSTTYPLTPIVGNALLDYIQLGRPNVSNRHVFFRVIPPPLEPYRAHAISARAAHYLRKAGIPVPRAGAHTLRHTCVQRLVDADVPFKTIGDFVGHRSPDSTAIYAKVAVDALREVALGDGEDVL